jgi:hypothetical protein
MPSQHHVLISDAVQERAMHATQSYIVQNPALSGAGFGRGGWLHPFGGQKTENVD